MPRVVFNQAASWNKDGCMDVYSKTDCCYCGRPVKADAKLLCLARTEDGEWWVVDPEYTPEPDDMDGYGMFTLPIGPDCLRRHPEFKFGVMPG